MNDPRGSIWRKWDLHAHTPIDMEWIEKPDLSTNEKKINFAKEYINFAKEQGLSVIAITDHNFCNRFEDLLIPFIQEEGTQRQITILPGFEITASDGSGIHLLVIFPETSDLIKIYNVVNHLFAPGQKRIPTDSNSHNIPYSQKSISQIRDTIENARLEAIFIFAHADRDNGVLDPNTIQGTRRVEEWQREFINICQLSKAPSAFTDDSFIYRVTHEQENYYKRNITYIIASDCRSIVKPLPDETIEQGRHYLGQKFTWIKANPTFEGLKQIIYEPEARVRIQDKNPEQDYKKSFFSKVFLNVGPIFEKDKPQFSNNVISLNSELSHFL